MNFPVHHVVLFFIAWGTMAGAGELQTTIKPAEGAATVITLNDAGLKTEHAYADGHKPVITWKPGGLPHTINTGLGNIVFNHSANGARDLVSITFPTRGPNAGSGAIGFTYDNAGRIATLGDDTGTRTFTWSFGHPLSETWNTGSAIARPLDGKRRWQGTIVTEASTPILTVTPDYNGPSRELNSISIDPDGVGGAGFTATFTRDAATRRITGISRGTVTQNFGRGTGGRITSAGSNVTGAPSFSYPDNTHDAQGRRTAANTNRGNWEYEYRGGENGDGQLHKATHTGHWDFVYNTDGIGRRVSVSSPASNGNLLANDDWDDPLNRFLSTYWLQQRILRASLDRDADVEITESHALPTLIPGLAPDPQVPLRDIVFPLTSPGTQGGWTAWSITGTLEGGGDPGAAPNRKAKLAGLTWFPPAEETFTYDNAGNRSGSARWSYTYDGLNRLTRAVNKDLATAPEAYDVLFTYDAEGRRHSKTSKRYSNGSLKAETHTTWIWDGWHPVVERIKDKHGQMLVERKLVWGPDLSGQVGGAGLPAIALATAGGAGGLLLIRETNHSFDGRPPVATDLLPLYDGSGNIVGLANPAGDLLAEYWYGPFGELLEATGPKADSNPWRWATKSLDKETGLVYFGLRYYDPSTGQWLSREPLGESESLNLYAYCHNDPINRVDVLGAEEWEWVNDAHSEGQRWVMWAAKNDHAILGTMLGVVSTLASIPKGLYSSGEHVGTQAAYAEEIALNAGNNGTYAAVETAVAELSGAKMLIESVSNERVMYTGNGQAASLGFDSKLDRALYGAGGGAQLFTCGVTPLSVSRTFRPYWQGYRASVPLRTTRISLAFSDALDAAPLNVGTAPRLTPLVCDTTGFSRAGTLDNFSEFRWTHLDPIVGIEGQPGIILNLNGLSAPKRHGLSDAFADLARFRRELGGIPAKGGAIPDGGTLAMLDIGGTRFYGINAHGTPRILGNAFNWTHAEIDALQQAFMAGKLVPKGGVIYVDKALCGYCRRIDGLPKALHELGVEELIIHDPTTSWRVTPSGTRSISPP